jgi:spermidine/putrescine transport system substrate-binding protein
MSPGLSRRSVLKGVGGAAFLGVSAAALPVFGTSSKQQNPLKCTTKDLSDTEKELIVSNWPLYIDQVGPNSKKTTTIEDFEAATGIKVAYTDDVSDNVEFFAKVVNQLGSCQPVNRDMFVVTDWMAARMVAAGWIQPLDHSAIPNVDNNMLKNLQNPAWDPNRDHSVPWQSGVTGIAYNADHTTEVKNFTELLTRSDLKGRVTLLTEMRDTMAFMLAATGSDPEKFTDADWDKAIELLDKANSDGQIRQFTGNNYVGPLSRGDVVACEAWSGDVLALQFDNPKIKFVLPEEGLSLWSDNMLIPNLATHRANAEAWMNYYYDPQVAAKLAAWVNYICPVEGAQKAMEKVDKSLVDNPLIFPTPEFLAGTFSMMPLSEAKASQYELDFENVIGG